MIDLVKEIQEAFEEMAHKMGMCLDQYWGDSFDNPYENDDTSLAYNIFREGAKSKQAEITELKKEIESLKSNQKITKPCRVGGGLFQVGVSINTVISASQRLHEQYLNNPEKPEVEMKELRKLIMGTHVLVPKEPTKRMITVGHGYWLPKDVYKAMIEASQQPTNLIDSFIADGGFDQAMGCKNGSR